MKYALALALVAAVGCGKPEPKTPAGEAAMPTGSGTQRALVLVDEDNAPPPSTTRPSSDPLSSENITKKVLRDVNSR